MQVSGWVGYDLSVITAQIDGRSQDICFGTKRWHYQTLCTQAADFYQHGNRPLSDNTKTATSAGVLVTPRLQPTQLDTCTSRALKIYKCQVSSLAGLTTLRTVHMSYKRSCIVLQAFIKAHRKFGCSILHYTSAIVQAYKPSTFHELCFMSEYCRDVHHRCCNMAIICSVYLSKCLSHAIDGEIEVPSSKL